MPNKESLGELAVNAGKGLVRVPLQAVKTSTNVANHTLKGVSKASEVVESTGEVVASAGKIASNAASIASATTSSVSGLAQRVNKSIEAKTKKLAAEKKSQINALSNTSVVKERNKSAQNNLIKNYKKKQLKTQKEIDNLTILQEQLESQLEIKRQKEEIKRMKRNHNMKNELNQQKRINNQRLVNSQQKNMEYVQKSIESLKKKQFYIIINECYRTLYALNAVSERLCGSSITGYHITCRLNRKLLNKSRNLQEEYKIFIDDLRFNINSISNSNSNSVFKKIDSKISNVRYLNMKLTDEFSKLNKIISSSNNNKNSKIETKINEMINLIKNFDINNVSKLNKNKNKINTINELEEELKLNLNNGNGNNKNNKNNAKVVLKNN